MTFLLFFIISYVLLSISLYLLFPKAGVDAVKGLIPGVNFLEWCKLIGRPGWWALLLLIPILNIFIFTGMAVDLVRSFGKYEFKHSAAAVLYAPAIFAKVAKSEKDQYVGPILDAEKDWVEKMNTAQANGNVAAMKRLQRDNIHYKSVAREWTEAIVFAVFAAAFIRMFLIEAYVIPTPSMEGSLLVGDFLFVSKAHYGIRTPETIAMLPLLHNRVPVVGGESYFKKPSLKPRRLPALESIDNNDPIVFNWPAGDSVYVTKKRPYSVEQVERNAGFAQRDNELRKLMKKKDFIVRPIDKKDHYIKRCVAKAGDSLHIRNKNVFINGKRATDPKEIQFIYSCSPEVMNSLTDRTKEKLGLDLTDQIGGNLLTLTPEQVEALKERNPNGVIQPYIQPIDAKGLYPQDPKNFPSWSLDNYGPIWIPKKGETIQLTPKNISLYRRVMNVYEHNDSYTEKNGQVIINGQEVSEYTFKQDYFWAMGDNRHNSEDSRAWGFVPHDHIVGKPLFIWFSTTNGNIGNGIRWNRIFSSANKF